jgi:hypothetical protein
MRLISAFRSTDVAANLPSTDENGFATKAKECQTGNQSWPFLLPSQGAALGGDLRGDIKLFLCTRKDRPGFKVNAALVAPNALRGKGRGGTRRNEDLEDMK